MCPLPVDQVPEPCDPVSAQVPEPWLPVHPSPLDGPVMLEQPDAARAMEMTSTAASCLILRDMSPPDGKFASWLDMLLVRSSRRGTDPDRPFLGHQVQDLGHSCWF